jgi:hypothetical protein
MSWSRLATFLAGAAAIVAGALIPGASPYLIPAGAALLGWGTIHPADKVQP